jgi:hypothetical protein
MHGQILLLGASLGVLLKLNHLPKLPPKPLPCHLLSLTLFLTLFLVPVESAVGRMVTEFSLGGWVRLLKPAQPESVLL